MGTSCSVAARSALTASSVDAFGVGLREGRNRQDLVDRRGLGLRFREAVALRQRGDLVGVDAVDEAIEVLPHPRVGPGAVWRLEEHIDRPIELDAGALEMTELQLALTGREMVLGGLDQRARWDREPAQGSARAPLAARSAPGRPGLFELSGSNRRPRRPSARSPGRDPPGAWDNSTNEHLGAPARSRRRWNCVRALLRFAPRPGGSCFNHHRLDRAAGTGELSSPRKRKP